MNILEEVKDAKTIGIGGHVRPDGDCVGSVTGLYLYLRKERPDARVDSFLQKPSEIFDCLKGVEELRTDFATDVGSYDVFIALDTNKERLGEAEKYFDSARKRINIDHHISNSGCGEANLIEPMCSSTAELVYRVMDAGRLDGDIAKALYLGIVHDTGVFRYSSTSPDTLRIAAELTEYGFDFPKLIDETYFQKSYNQAQILGRALLESFLFLDGKCVVSQIDRKTMAFYNAEPKDMEGIVGQLRDIKGVECAIFMYQQETMEYKVSLRSGGLVDVEKVASFFGGGGHRRAAGCMMNGTFYDVVNNLSLHIAGQLKEKEA